MKLNGSFKVGTLIVEEYGKRGKIKNKVILKDLAADISGKSKASEYIAGLDLIKSAIKKGLKALRDWRPFIAEQINADRAERKERERLERIAERERAERVRKNPKGWRHVRA